MPALRKLAISLPFGVTANLVFAQQAATPQSILAGAVALMGAANIPGTTLSGSAEFIAGSTAETGSFIAS